MTWHRIGAVAAAIALSSCAGPVSGELAAHRVVAGAEPGRVAASTGHSYTGGTLMLSGTLSSTATITMTGAFSVGHISGLTWELPLPQSLKLNGYTQTVEATTYHFSIQPTSSRVGISGANRVTVFHWNSPPANTVISVVETVHATVRSTLGPFLSRARFPLSVLPASVKPYKRITQRLFLFRHGRRLARRLTWGHRSEQGVVESVANWVATHLHYDPTGDTHSVSAGWVLHHPGTTCRGYANTMVSLLHYEGIPAQVEYGWLSSAPIHLHGANGASSTIRWGDEGTQGAMHAWLQIYFPGDGWVPFDPQHEKFFIDPRHFGFATYADAGTPRLGIWTATVPDGETAIGASLANGYAEISPGDGLGSRVTITGMHDTFRARMHGVRHDVHGVLLLSR